MSGSSKKVAVLLVILLGICAGAYFIGLPMLEKQQSANAVEIIKSLPGNFTAEEVKVGYFSKKVTIKGLKGTPEITPGIVYELEFGQVELEGINMEAGFKPGTAHLADSIKVMDARAKSSFKMPEMPQEMVATSSCKEITLKGVRGDLVALFGLEPLPLVSEHSSPEEARRYIAALNKMMAAFGTFHIDKAEAKEYSAGMQGPIAFNWTAGRFAYSDASITKFGPMQVDDLKVSALNSQVATVEKIHCQGMVIPDIFTIQMDVYDPEAYGKEMMQVFAKTPMLVKGLVFEKMTVTPMTSEALTLDKASFDMELGLEKVSVMKEIKNLVIPVSVYSMISGEAAMFGVMHKQPLMLDGNVDFALNQKDGKGDLLVRKVMLSESNLGNATFTGELPFFGQGDTLEDLLVGGASFLLKTATLVVEDKKGMELFLAMQLAPGSGQNPTSMSTATLRSGIVDGLKALAAQQNTADKKKIIEGVAQLVGAPGKLHISVTPPQPVAIEGIERGDAPLNAKVEYTPAK